MTEENFREIGKRLSSSFHLTTRPLVVYGSESLPPGAVHMAEVDRCFAISLYRMATENEITAIYVSVRIRRKGVVLEVLELRDSILSRILLNILSLQEGRILWEGLPNT